jgi:hypothetical protein
MTQINLNSTQIDRLKPIKEAGGYSSITSVIGALIAIYSDDLLNRIVSPPNTAPLPPSSALSTSNTLPKSSFHAPLSPPDAVPLSPSTAPKRPKFDL